MEKENIIFGIRPVAEAIEARKQIERIYIKKGAEGALMNDLKDLMARHHLRWQEVCSNKRRSKCCEISGK